MNKETEKCATESGPSGSTPPCCSAVRWIGKTVTSRDDSGWGEAPVSGVVAKHEDWPGDNRFTLEEGWFDLVTEDGKTCLAATCEFYPPNAEADRT